VNLVALWLLLPVMGLHGAGLAMVAGYLVSSAFLTGGFIRFSELSIRETWHVQRSDSALIVNALKYVHQRLLANHG
jgi:Na+-driven multidrug efflux pump